MSNLISVTSITEVNRHILAKCFLQIIKPRYIN